MVAMTLSYLDDGWYFVTPFPIFWLLHSFHLLFCVVLQALRGWCKCLVFILTFCAVMGLCVVFILSKDSLFKIHLSVGIDIDI